MTSFFSWRIASVLTLAGLASIAVGSYSFGQDGGGDPPPNQETPPMPCWTDDDGHVHYYDPDTQCCCANAKQTAGRPPVPGSNPVQFRPCP